jgi:hypothetical protein
MVRTRIIHAGIVDAVAHIEEMGPETADIGIAAEHVEEVHRWIGVAKHDRAVLTGIMARSTVMFSVTSGQSIPSGWWYT